MPSFCAVGKHGLLYLFLLSTLIVAACGRIHGDIHHRHHGVKRIPAAPADKTVIIQMFEWDWDSLARECTEFIGPAGYGFVQTSPPQEHIQGPQWWTDYQPVSYNLVSKRGNRQQFEGMVAACHAAGVGVIADSVLNHMTAGPAGVGVDGHDYSQFSYPAVPYADDGDFHHCNNGHDDTIVDYDNATEVWTCALSGLADLATDTSENVRAKEAAYLNDLLSVGVDGFRLDAAKSINPADIANITGRLSYRTKPYITQEVMWGPDQAVEPSMYVSNGDVMEFRYTSALQSAFLGSGVSALGDLDDQGWVPGASANVFVADHDTERSGASLNWTSPLNSYILAHVFSLAHPYGRPTVLSSYEYTGYDDGAPNNGSGTCSGDGGSNGWLCQHRWTPMAGMVGFRNHVGGAPLAGWASPQSSQIAFQRGALGFVAINNADADWITTFDVALPAGSYCDVVSGQASALGACTGIGVTVAQDGTLSAVVPARGAIAVHTGAQGRGSAVVPVTFVEHAITIWGENIFLTGSLPQLGNWNTSHALALSSGPYPNWTVTVELPINTRFEYKFFRVEPNGTVEWESDPNRSDTTPSSELQEINDTWR